MRVDKVTNDNVPAVSTSFSKHNVCFLLRLSELLILTDCHFLNKKNEFLLNNTTNLQLHKLNIITVSKLVFTSRVSLLFCAPAWIVFKANFFFFSCQWLQVGRYAACLQKSWWTHKLWPKAELSCLLYVAHSTLILSSLFWTLLLPLPTLERIQWMFTLLMFNCLICVAKRRVYKSILNIPAVCRN